MKEFFLVTSVLFLVSSALAQVKRPRGVAISSEFCCTTCMQRAMVYDSDSNAKAQPPVDWAHILFH